MSPDAVSTSATGILPTAADDMASDAAADRMMTALADPEHQRKTIELLRMLAEDSIDVTLTGIDPDVVEMAQDLCANLGI